MPIVVKEIPVLVNYFDDDGNFRSTKVVGRSRGKLFIHPAIIDTDGKKPVLATTLWSIVNRHGLRLCTVDGIRKANRVADMLNDCITRNKMNIDVHKETIMNGNDLKPLRDLLVLLKKNGEIE